MLGLVVLLYACEGADESPDGAAEHDNVFQGTVLEHSDAMADCFASLGWAVEPDPDDPSSFSIDSGVIDDDLVAEKIDECQQEVGFWTPESLSDEYVRQLYEHAKWQRECLIDLGYELAEPPSFESFDERRDWDPFGEVASAARLRGLDFLRVRDQCPYFHQWEAQQETGQ